MKKKSANRSRLWEMCLAVGGRTRKARLLEKGFETRLGSISMDPNPSFAS